MSTLVIIYAYINSNIINIDFCVFGPTIHAGPVSNRSFLFLKRGVTIPRRRVSVQCIKKMRHINNRGTIRILGERGGWRLSAIYN